VFIEAAENFSAVAGSYARGHVYDVADLDGREWCRKGLARETVQNPPHVASLLARLDDGAGRPCLFLPFVGEFGHEIMSHVRLVHFHKASRKVVCCRPGAEVLYPSADEYVTDWMDPISDRHRVATIRYTLSIWEEIEAKYPGFKPIPAGNLLPEQEIFIVRQDERIPFRPKNRGLWADVVLGIRRRDFARERNWPHWQQLADAIGAEGFSVGVAGRRPTTEDVRGQVWHTGDYDTDAAIELMRHCRLYIGTDTGISHLAAEVGCPMLLFRETHCGSRDLTPRMEQVNPGITEIVRSGWTRPDLVIAHALQRLRGQL
jgi:hypothetical protein